MKKRFVFLILWVVQLLMVAHAVSDFSAESAQQTGISIVSQVCGLIGYYKVWFVGALLGWRAITSSMQYSAGDSSATLNFGIGLLAALAAMVLPGVALEWVGFPNSGC
jgi:hypothetical protein